MQELGKTVKKGWAVYLAFLGLAATSSGCLVAAAGAVGGAAVGYAYFQGELNGQFPQTLSDTHVATKKALAELGMPVVKEDIQSATGTIESRTKDGDSVTIKLSDVTPRTQGTAAQTKVAVRVGLFGNDAASEAILDQIGGRLNQGSGGRLRPVARANPNPIQQTSGTSAPNQTGPPPLATAPIQNETGPPPLATGPK